MTTTYRDLQATLKAYKADGVTLQCKLNANAATLQAEVTRIMETHHGYSSVPSTDGLLLGQYYPCCGVTFQPTQPITPVHFTFDDGLCLGHSTPTLFDTYVMHNHAQPSEQHDSELTRESFNEARELYPTRIANNYLHYICLVLAYVYATIYIGCQVTHRAIALTTLHVRAWYLIAVIKRTLADVTHNAQHGTT